MLAAVAPRIKDDLFAAGNPEAAYWLAWDPDVRAWMGLLPAAFLVSYMIASPLFGWLGDRINRWVLIACGVLAWSLASGASGLATSFGMLLASRLMVGIGEAAYAPVAPTLIADQFPVDHRSRMLSYFYIAIPVGSALGYAFGGVVASHWTWHWAFFLSVPPGIALALVALFMREPARGQSEHAAAAAPKASWRDYKAFLKTPSYVFATLGMTALTFAMGGIAFWIPEYVAEYRHIWSLERVNITFGGVTVVSGLSATLLGGWTADKLQKRWKGSYFIVSGIGAILAAPCFLGVLYAPISSPWQLWALIFATEFCLFFNTGPANAILANVTHPSVRASAFAFNILIIHLFGDVISPTLIGKITDRYGGNMNTGFATVSLVIFLAGVLWLCGTPFLGRDTRLALDSARRAGARPDRAGSRPRALLASRAQCAAIAARNVLARPDWPASSQAFL